MWQKTNVTLTHNEIAVIMIEKSHKCKILFISHISGLDGAERSLLDLLRGLDKEKYSILVLFPRQGPLKTLVQRTGCNTMILDMPWWIACGQRDRWHFQKVFGGMLKRVKRLYSLIKTEKINIVYSNTITCIDGALTAKLAGIPHVWHIREIVNAHAGLRPYVPSCLLPVVVDLLSDRIVVPSNFAKKNIAWKNSLCKTHVVHNSVNLTQFDTIIYEKKPKKLRRELCLTKGIKVVALIGSFSENKGQADFVQAASIVCRFVENVVFLLVGGGSASYTTFVKNEVTRLGIEDKVYFLGFKQNIEEIINSVDVLVCASLVESFSRTIVESMAARKPIVATACGGPEEIVVEEETGFLVPIRNSDKLASAIIQLLTNENRAKKMGYQGRQRVEKLFTVEKYVKNIENIIDGLC